VAQPCKVVLTHSFKPEKRSCYFGVGLARANDPTDEQTYLVRHLCLAKRGGGSTQYSENVVVVNPPSSRYAPE